MGTTLRKVAVVESKTERGAHVDGTYVLNQSVCRHTACSHTQSALEALYETGHNGVSAVVS